MMLLFLAATIIILNATTSSASAFRIGDADPLINNIWLEPKYPKPGELVSINASIYNQGTESTKEVTDVVTIGYFVDGELIQINELADVPPGIDNGIRITTGPIWEATDGIHVITVIINYHDTLSHLTDNLDNNIMQKRYHIGDWQSSLQPLISFDLFQEKIPDMEKQLVKTIGNVEFPDFFPKYISPKIDLEISENGNIIRKHSIEVDKDTGYFYWKETMPIFRTDLQMSASLLDERYGEFFSVYSSNLYPVNLERNESLLAIDLSSSTGTYNFKNQKFTVIVYDESYKLITMEKTNEIIDYPVKEIQTIQLPASPHVFEKPPATPNPILSTSLDGDILYIILPGGKVYNFEIYSENKLEYSSVKFMEPNKIETAIIAENQNPYHQNLRQDEFLLSLNLSDPMKIHSFEDSDVIVVLFQDSYDNLFKKIQTTGFDKTSAIFEENLLTVLPANHKYIGEIYLEGRFLTSFETDSPNKTMITKDIVIPKPAQIQFKVFNESGNLQSDASVHNWIYSGTSNIDGLTDWIKIIPTITDSEPYAANAILPNGKMVWSDPFYIKSGEVKTVPIGKENLE